MASVAYIEGELCRCRLKWGDVDSECGIHSLETGTKTAQKKRVTLLQLSDFQCGVTGNRTRDTRIFSPLLYQLSYDTIVKNYPFFSNGIAKIDKNVHTPNFSLQNLIFFKYSGIKCQFISDSL